MLCVVAPVLHKYVPVLDEAVRITLPPMQKVKGPFAVIVGTPVGVTITVTAAEVPPHKPVVVTV